jgi:hypothetical protein
MNQSTATIIGAFIAAVIGGLGSAAVNHFVNRKKTKAETNKLLAETEKIQAEIRNLSATVAYGLPNAEEVVVLDGTNGIDGFDVEGKEGRFWRSEPTSSEPLGRGSLSFEEGGILNVRRQNTEGRFELWVRRYLFDKKSSRVIPKNDLKEGNRRLRVSCEAKTVDAEHTLRFLIRDEKTGARSSERLERVSGNRWVPIHVYLQADATADTVLRIDDESVSAAPSSIQIRNLKIVEKLS